MKHKFVPILRSLDILAIGIGGINWSNLKLKAIFDSAFHG